MTVIVTGLLVYVMLVPKSSFTVFDKVRHGAVFVEAILTEHVEKTIHTIIKKFKIFFMMISPYIIMYNAWTVDIGSYFIHILYTMH